MRSRVAVSVLVLSLAALAEACQSSALSTSPSVAPDPGVEGGSEDPALGEPPLEPPVERPAPDCRLRSSWAAPPTTVCSAATALCVEEAASSSAAQACVDADSSCTACVGDAVLGCLVGTAKRPGPCAPQAGRVDGCVLAQCGQKPSASCRSAARASGECKQASKALQACIDTSSQASCVPMVRAACLPEPSCGNKVVEKGETCDGDCPTACPAPPAGDLCTTNVLQGNAATCSATCEAQSKCPANCPTNAAPVSAVGVIASGVALPTTTQAKWPTLAELKATGCPSVNYASSEVIAWKGPSAGSYTLSATCSVTWQETEKGTGRKFTHALECIRRVAVAKGKQCAAGVAPFACSLDVDHYYKQSQLPDKASLAPIQLAAGDELLVAADFGVAYLPPSDTANTYGGHVIAESWSVTATK